MRNQKRKIELQKIVHRKICARGITFLTARCTVSPSTPSPFLSDVLAEWPLLRYRILLWVVFCVAISRVNGRKYENLLQFNTSWLASLKKRCFRLCFSFYCSGYELILIKKSRNCYSFLQKFFWKTRTYKLVVGNYDGSIYC